MEVHTTRIGSLIKSERGYYQRSNEGRRDFRLLHQNTSKPVQKELEWREVVRKKKEREKEM